MASSLPQRTDEPVTVPIPDRYTVGDSLKWDAPWVDVRLWVELPFWLMVNNTSVPVKHEGHEFAVAIQDNYAELFFGTADDSRTTVGYRGPVKKPEDLPDLLRQTLEEHPAVPRMWRKSKSYLKVESRCNEDVWNAASSEDKLPRANEIRLYLAELCRAHIPVVNTLIRAYHLATYDYFAFEVSPWDVPIWSVERDGHTFSSLLVGYRGWDCKPMIHDSGDGSREPHVYSLIEANRLQNQISSIPTPGEMELLDALNLMERGDYSGAVRRITTAIEVVVEDVAGKAMEAAKGRQAAEKFLHDTRMRFDERFKMYERLAGRKAPGPFVEQLRETRNLRHRIVHGGYRIDASERGKAQKAVDVGRWIFNWFENDQGRRDVRETRIAFRSLGRDLETGIFNPKITPEGVVLSHPALVR